MLQKRILAAVLSLVMAITMITPVTAASPSEVEPAVFCWHKYTVSGLDVYPFQYRDQDSHVRRVDDYVKCRYCDDKKITQTYYEPGRHSYNTTVLSDVSHVGNFDVYTYSDVCSGCKHYRFSYTEKKPCSGACDIPLV